MGNKGNRQFFNTIFVPSHMYYVAREPRRDPSNRRLYMNMGMIYIRHCQESNSQPVPSQVRADSTRAQWRTKQQLSKHFIAPPPVQHWPTIYVSSCHAVQGLKSRRPSPQLSRILYGATETHRNPENCNALPSNFHFYSISFSIYFNHCSMPLSISTTVPCRYLLQPLFHAAI